VTALQSAPTRARPGGRTWPVLDGVRGVAVVAVVIWHAYRLTIGRGMGRDDVPVIWWPLGSLRFAVDVFFVLSGMLVVQSWHAARRRSRSLPSALWQYGTNRAARIVPAYWVMLAILIPLVGQWEPLLAHPKRLFAFVTLNQYAKWWLPERVNPVTWTLTVEWHFYLLVPLVVWLLARVNRWAVLAGSLTLTVVWWLETPYRLPDSFIFGRLDQFVAGAIVGYLVVEHSEGAGSAIVDWCTRRHAFVAACVTIVAFGTYHGASLGLAANPVVDAFLHPVVGVCTAIALLHILTTKRWSVLDHPTVRWFGTVSFGLYLWHYPILDYGLRWTRTQIPEPNITQTVLAVLILCMCSVGAAAISYWLVERPFLSLKDRRKRAERKDPTSTLSPWPSPRSSASKRSTESPSAALPIRTLSSRQAS
jgi:peptidoglycan/LPS O-acetylase OafA/YrhL